MDVAESTDNSIDSLGAHETGKQISAYISESITAISDRSLKHRYSCRWQYGCDFHSKWLKRFRYQR